MNAPRRWWPRRAHVAAWLTGAAACGLLGVAGQAQARTVVVTLGLTDSFPAPHVIVDGSGRGYVTWTGDGSGEPVEYCRLTISPSACGSRQVFSHSASGDQSGDAGNSPVFTASGAIAIVDSRCCLLSNQKFLYTSSDGGRSFGVPVPLASDGASGMNGNVLDLPPGALSAGSPEQLITTDAGAVTGGGSVQATGLNASASDPGFYQPPVAGDGTVSESIARAGSTLVVVYTQPTSPAGRVSWVKDSGGGDPDASSSWSAPQSISPLPALDSHAQLAGGPAGIFVARSVGRPGDNEALVVQRFTGTGWTAPVTISTSEQGGFGITETPTGRVYVAWSDTSGRLHYRVAANRTATRFGRAVNLRTGPERVSSPSIAVNGAGAGWITWTDDTDHAFALVITPRPKHTVLKLSDGGRLVLVTPGGCIAPGARFTATLALTAAKPEHRVYLRVSRVGFSVTAGGTTTVRRPVFRAALTLPGSAHPGSAVKVRAKATLVVAHGKGPAKLLSTSLAVCP
jgi:hypothetical protein